MKLDFCAQLDDYLAEQLRGDSRTQFERHLAQCPGCHRALQLQQSIDTALRTANQAVALPAGLAERVSRRQVDHRRRRRRALVALSAAAALLICGGLALWQRWPADRPAVSLPQNREQREVTAPRGPVEPARAPPVEPDTPVVTVSPVDNSAAIVTQWQTQDPSVSVFMVYPVYTTSAPEGL